MATFVKDDGAIEMIIDDSNEVFGRMYRSLVNAWTRFVGQCSAECGIISTVLVHGQR